MRDIFLSDIHIGVDASTNLYQSSVHGPALKAVLQYIQDPKNEIRNVIILGDWIDLWMYKTTAVPMETIPENREGFLPTARQIFEANPGIFADFAACMKKISGKFYYLNGNHDISVTPDDIYSYFGDQANICCVGNTYEPPNGPKYLYGQHGHLFSMVCKPDPRGYSLPFGYYMTRAAADGKMTAPADPADTIKILTELTQKGYSFAEAMLICIGRQSDPPTSGSYTVAMPTDFSEKIMTSDKLIGMFKNSTPEDDFEFNLTEFENTDYLKGNLQPYAEELIAENLDRKLVILGHTHDEELCPKIKQVFVNKSVDALYSTYVNTGFLCGKPATSPSQKSTISTFIEVFYNGSWKKKLTVCTVDIAGTIDKIRTIDV
jgi:UDP-2,3-diacylglucosamine pyrophosphatase LpxH